jgi:undecaprenyl-diphosphatase
MFDFLVELDKELFLWLNGLHHPSLDGIMWWISAKTSWIPLYFIIVFFIISRFKWKALPALLLVFILILISDQVSVMMKENIQRFRPSHDPVISQFVHVINDYRGGKYGFVSSHAANSFALATYVSLLFNKRWLWWAMIFWAVLVSYSRIYLGVHYPADVTGGAILGVLDGLFVYYLYLVITKKWFHNAA